MADDSPIFFWKAEEAEFGFLCQWYPSPFYCDIVQDGKNVGIKFKHAEQYMMYRKATHFNDHDTACNILLTSSPRKCKALGSKADGFTGIEWDKVKSQIVEEGSYYKFTRWEGKGGEDLRSMLLSTGNRELVEASPFDRVWSVGFGADMLRKGAEAGARREKWGENRLGKALMVVRDRIRKEEEEKQGGKKED